MRIAYIVNGMTTFARCDLEILCQEHQVQVVDFCFRPQQIAALRKTVSWAEVVFCWFAARHALLACTLASIQRKPSIVVTGGYDVVNMPEIRYGSMRGEPTRSMVKLIVGMADRLLAISESNQRELVENTGVAPHKVERIYLGVGYQNSYVPAEKEQMALTVGNVVRDNLKRKGLEEFVQAAAYLPHISFAVVGRWGDDAIDLLRSLATDNVHFAGYLTREELEGWMKRAKVYVQASAHEAFGLALAEAMLWGCVPVTTARGSLPEVAGGLGPLVPVDDPGALARGIEEAMQAEHRVAQDCRSHIIERFPLEERRGELLRVVDEVVSRRGLA